MSTQQLTAICKENMDSFRAYLEGDLSSEATAALRQHLKVCRTCQQEFEAQQQVVGLLDQAYSERKISSNFDQSADKKLLALSNRSKLPGVVATAPNAAFRRNGNSSSEIFSGAY